MVTVCIPTFKRPESLSIVLGSLISETENFDEILVGITGDIKDSVGEMGGIIKQLDKAFQIQGVSVVFKSGLSGLMSAKKWFKEIAKNDILLLVDDDAILGKGYFELTHHFLDNEVGAVSGVLQTPVNVGGYKDWSNKPILVHDSYSNTLYYDKRRKTINWYDKYQVYMHEDNKVFECQYLIGTALFIRKDLLEIDLEFENGTCAGEEIDFTYSIYRKGYKLYFDSSAICWHLHENRGGMREKDRSKDRENFDYLVRKWGLGEGVEDSCSHYIRGGQDE